MAKKQDQAEKKEASPDTAEAPKAEKKPKEPKAEKKPKEPKEAKASPEAPPAEKPAPAEAAQPAAPAAPDGVKKKGKRPGVPPLRGKKLRQHMNNIVQKLTKEGATDVKKAVGLLKQIKRSKFDETVEVHMSLGVDVSQSDQSVRGTVALPHGIGKSVRVVVFCQGDDVAKAKAAGADFAGSDDLIQKIQKENWLEFDVALAMQNMMGQVSRLGKVLGPRGLMPTPKAGTVVTGDVGNAVKEFKAGKVEYRTDKGGNIHAGVGKLSFDEQKLTENIAAFVEQVRAAKPTGIKGNYILSVTLCSTMSPGIPVTV